MMTNSKKMLLLGNWVGRVESSFFFVGFVVLSFFVILLFFDFFFFFLLLSGEGGGFGRKINACALSEPAQWGCNRGAGNVHARWVGRRGRFAGQFCLGPSPPALLPGMEIPDGAKRAHVPAKMPPQLFLASSAMLPPIPLSDNRTAALLSLIAARFRHSKPPPIPQPNPLGESTNFCPM